MQAESADNMKDEDVLLKYIDIPYFRNNPSYIERWRRYYLKQNKDPQILLLMHHKQISTYFHWLYLELSSYFLKIGKPELASFVLNEALKINVYDESRIKKALSKIPNFEKQYSRGDLLAVLNQRNIKALGTVWNCFEEEIFYLQHLPEGFVNFEIKQILYYENKYGNKHMVLTRKNAELETEDSSKGCSQDACKDKDKLEKIHKCSYAYKSKNDNFTTKIADEGDLEENILNTENLPSKSKFEADASNLSLADSPFAFDNPAEEQNADISIDYSEAEQTTACKEILAQAGNDTAYNDAKIEFNTLPSSFIEDENEESKTAACESTFEENENDAVGNSNITENVNRNTRIDEGTANSRLSERINSKKSSIEQKDEPEIAVELNCENLENDLTFANKKKEHLEDEDQACIEDSNSIDSAFTSKDSCQTESMSPKVLESNDEISEGSDVKYKIKAQDDMDKDYKKFKAESPSTFKTLFQPSFLEIDGDLVLNSEIVIEKYIYLIQSFDINAFYLLRLAKDGDVTQTMIGKYFILKEASSKNALIAKDLFSYSCCQKDSKFYVLFEHSKIAHLNSIIFTCSSTVRLFYLRQIVGNLVNLRENDITVSDPLDFFVSHNFTLILNSFDFLDASEKNIAKIEESLAKALKIDKVEISSDFLAAVDQDLSTGAAKKEILNHKAWVLENL